MGPNVNNGKVTTIQWHVDSCSARVLQSSTGLGPRADTVQPLHGGHHSRQNFLPEV